MRFGTNRQNSNPYSHYTCSQYGQGLKRCSSHYIRYDYLYHYVLLRVQVNSTGVEIWNDTDGQADIFVAGIGTGGTITGTGKYLKSKNPDIKVVGFEPLSSPYLTEGKTGAHKLQGIGAGFKPEILDLDVCDEIITVANEDAMVMGRFAAEKEGIMVGITSGAAIWTACELAKREENEGKLIVALLPDTGERYLTTELFS